MDCPSVGVDGNGHNQISGGIQLTGPDVAGLTITQQAYDGLFRQATEEDSVLGRAYCKIHFSLSPLPLFIKVFYSARAKIQFYPTKVRDVVSVLVASLLDTIMRISPVYTERGKKREII